MLKIVLNQNSNNNLFEKIHCHNFSQRRSFDKNLLWPLGPPIQNETILKQASEIELKKNDNFKNTLKDKYFSIKKILDSYFHADFEPYIIHI